MPMLNIQKPKIKLIKVIDCKYFTTNSIILDGSLTIEKNKKSFTVYMCVDGDFELLYDEKLYKYTKGDTILLPAAISKFQIVGNATILEIYIS
jgi:mannose-6-phosphate isomerase